MCGCGMVLCGEYYDRATNRQPQGTGLVCGMVLLQYLCVEMLLFISTVGRTLSCRALESK